MIIKYIRFLFLFSFSLWAGLPPAPGGEMPSPEELQAMVEDIEKNDPELFKLLQEEGRRILIENGIDPDTFEQPKAEPTSEEKKAPAVISENNKKPLVQAEKTEQAAPTVRGVKEIEFLLTSLNQALNAMRLKAHVNNNIARLLERFKRELDDLLYYVPVLKNQPIITYLATAAYTPLYMRLKSFTHKIIDLEQQLRVDDIYAEKHDTPYHILSLRPASSIKEIEAAFKRLMKAKDPKALKKNLKEGNFSKKEQEAILQDNELQRRSLQEAYNLLMDSNTKKRLDREHELRISQRLAGGTVSKELLSAIGKTFTDFIYTERALEDIKKVIAQYDPEAAKNKIKIEEEIKQERERIQEAKKRSQQPSVRTQGSAKTYYPEYRPAGSAGYGGGSFAPDYGYGNQPYNPGSSNAPTPAEKPKDSPIGKPRDGKDKDKEDDSDKDKDKSKDKDKKSNKDDKKTRSKDDKKEKSFADQIKSITLALQRTDHALITSDISHVKDTDLTESKSAYDSLELESLIAKLSDLYTWLIDPKQKKYFATDKDKKEAGQQWESTVLQRSKQILEKLLNFLSKEMDPISEDKAISYVEMLSKDTDDIRALLLNISKELGLAVVKRGNLAPKPIFELLNKPAKTDVFYGLLIDVRKEIDKGDGANLKLLKDHLAKIAAHINELTDEDKKAQEKVWWSNKILPGSTLLFLQNLAVPDEKKRAPIDQEAQDEPDQIDTIFLLFKNISQSYGINEADNEILKLVSKNRRIPD